MRQTEPDARLVRALQLLLMMLLFGGWEMASRNSRTLGFFISRPTAILGRVVTWAQEGKIWGDVFVTLHETFWGFTGGVTLGLVLAFASYRWRLLEHVLRPFFAIGNGMPRVIFGPIFILWFGLGIASKVVLGITIIVFLVYFATYQGLQEVDRNLINKVRLLGGSEGDVLLHVLIPSALSWVFTSLRVSVGFALIAAIVGEYMGSSKGLGHRIQFAEGMFDAAGIFAGLLVLSVVVLVLNAILERVEARFSAWKPSQG